MHLLSSAKRAYYTEKLPKRLEGKRLVNAWLAASARRRSFRLRAVSDLESLDRPGEVRIFPCLTSGLSPHFSRLDLPYKPGYNAPIPMTG
jgi:hypothetical protein